MGVILAVKIPARRTGVTAASARDIGAVCAVPCTEAAAIAGKLGALALVQQVRVDLAQEGGRRVAPRLAEDHPRAGSRQVQFLFCAGDGDIAKAALLLHVLLIILGHITGEDAVLHTYDKNVGELQALGRVYRHHCDAVRVVVIAVQVGDQCDFLQEAGECRVLAVLIGVGLDGADELTQVLAPGLALLLHSFQHGLVAGLGNDVANKHIQRLTDREVAQLTVHLVKAFQCGGGPLQFGILAHMGDDLHHRHTLTSSQLTDFFNRCCANFTCRFVDDAAQAHIVAGVDDDG